MARWEDKNFKDLSVLIKIRRNFWLTGQDFRLSGFLSGERLPVSAAIIVVAEPDKYNQKNKQYSQ